MGKCWTGSVGVITDSKQKLTQSLLSIDPRLANKSSLLESQVSSLVQGQGDSLTGVVELVLDANPGLVDYGPVLPAGVKLQLPEIAPHVENNAVVRLWDE